MHLTTGLTPVHTPQACTPRGAHIGLVTLAPNQGASWNGGYWSVTRRKA